MVLRTGSISIPGLPRTLRRSVPPHAAERKARKQGITRPELAGVLSYAKIDVYNALMESDETLEDFLKTHPMRYFPEVLRRRYLDFIPQHRLSPHGGVGPGRSGRDGRVRRGCRRGLRRRGRGFGIRLRGGLAHPSLCLRR